MLSILSAILGFATSGLPSVLDFFKQKGDQKHEREMAEIEMRRAMELAKAGYASQEKLKNLKLTKSRWTRTLKSDSRFTSMMKNSRTARLLGLLISVLVFAPLSPIFLLLFSYLLILPE